ncbi:hypothetical protein ACQP2T_61455 [Nonomuraea sp. CA-143628]|uniref:hypothetical protein n=1 Tax=Nonomuraea sp. CA-143628 TaxID=3239997 RepID=UPI003D91C44A
MAPLNAEQAAAQLGIRDKYRDLFVLLVGRMQEPAAHEAELARLRGELDAVNEALRKAGIDYPQGARGIRDLYNAFQGALDARDEAKDKLRTLKAVTERVEGAEIVGAGTYPA